MHWFVRLTGFHCFFTDLPVMPVYPRLNAKGSTTQEERISRALGCLEACDLPCPPDETRWSNDTWLQHATTMLQISSSLRRLRHWRYCKIKMIKIVKTKLFHVSIFFSEIVHTDITHTVSRSLENIGFSPPQHHWDQEEIYGRKLHHVAPCMLNLFTFSWPS